VEQPCIQQQKAMRIDDPAGGLHVGLGRGVASIFIPCHVSPAPHTRDQQHIPQDETCLEAGPVNPDSWVLEVSQPGRSLSLGWPAQDG